MVYGSPCSFNRGEVLQDYFSVLALLTDDGGDDDDSSDEAEDTRKQPVCKVDLKELAAGDEDMVEDLELSDQD